MDWTAHTDGYCERLEPGLWAEPINAVTNLAFVVGAAWLWPRVRGDRGAQALAVSLFSIGVASGLFHTFAQAWAGLADVLSILIYILIYLYLATHRMLERSKLWALASVVLFFPYAAATGAAISAVAGPLNGSVSYLPVLLLIAIYAVLTRAKPAISKGLWIGVGLLALSLLARTVDEALCAHLPLGTHFLWHILNGIMLTHMAYVMTKHAPALEPARPQG